MALLFYKKLSLRGVMFIMANGITDTIGVYGIYNKLTGECIYVGSGGLRNRESSHLGGLRNKTHKNKLLQKIYDEIGEENFENKILETCSEENKLEIETNYWKKLNPLCCLEPPKPCPRYQESYPKMSAAQRGTNNPNNKYDIDTIIEIKQMIQMGLSNKEIERKTGINDGYISQIRTGQKWGHIQLPPI